MSWALTPICPYCQQTGLTWTRGAILTNCHCCRRTSIRFSLNPATSALRTMPLDNLLTAIAGAALVTAFLGYATSRLTAHMMITTLACYTSAIGAISLIEAACAWSTGLYRTKIRSRLITRTARSYALFNLAWGIFALGLGVYGLLLA